MKKVILNKCYGGFDVSYLAHKLYAKRKFNIDEIYSYIWDRNGYIKQEIGEDGPFILFFLRDLGELIPHDSFKEYKKDMLRLDEDYREDKLLIEIVEELGADASGRMGDLKIVEIPDDLDYMIDDYDGIETLHQRVQVW